MGKMNWGEEAKKSARPIYPSGSYKVRVDEWEPCEARTGTPQVRWFFKMLEPAKYAGEPLVDHTPLTDSALWKLAKLVSASGVVLKDVPTMEIMSESFKDVLDMAKQRVLWVKVKHDEQYNNNKVEDYVAVDESEQPKVAYSGTKKDDAAPF